MSNNMHMMQLFAVAPLWLLGYFLMNPYQQVVVEAWQSNKIAKSRREALQWFVGGTATFPFVANAESGSTTMVDRFDVDDFLRTGVVVNPMGISGQSGKSRPETGVVLRDGSEVSRDPRTGDVLAEILLESSAASGGRMPVLASYSSPWPLATGTVYDVECRDANTGDGAFLAVSSNVNGKAIGELNDSFFVQNLVGPTGRFSAYGTPTDVKVRNSETQGDYRLFDLSFSTLSQSTQSEIPRKAKVIATIPRGTEQAVMLVGSASALRWKKGAEKSIASTIQSFRAVPAPETSMKVRAKERRSG